MKTFKSLLLAMLVPFCSYADELPADEPDASLPPPAVDGGLPSNAAVGSPPSLLLDGGSNPVPNGALAALQDKEREGGFALTIDLDHSLGTGTFVNPALYAYFGASLSIVPRYVFTVKSVTLSVSAALRGAWEYTLPDNENGRRFSPYDSRIGLSAPSLYRNGFTGITVSPSLGVVVPTTPESWQAGLITNISVGVALARTIGRFGLGVSANGSRGFHQTGASQVAARAPDSAEQLNSFAARKSALGKDEAYVGFAAWNTAWAFNVGGNLSFQATDALSFVIGYTYSRSWKYYGVPLGPDETLPAYARPGPGQAERTAGVLGVNYQLTDHYGVSLSASTLQTPRSGAMGAAGYFRFPFWAIGNAAENATFLSFTFSASY